MYQFQVLDICGNKQITLDESDICSICKQKCGDATYVCIECGSLSCQTHHINCKRCEKDLCNNCALKVPKLLLFSDFYCTECGKNIELTKEKSRGGLIDQGIDFELSQKIVGGIFLLLALTSLIKFKLVGMILFLLAGYLTIPTFYSDFKNRFFDLSTKKRIIVIAIIAIIALGQ